MLKKIGLALAALVVVLVVVIATRPAAFSVTRATTIAAPAEVPYALVEDFHAWGGWSPWDKLDPSMQRTFSGPAAGIGAAYAWTGNDQVGEGRMTIVDATPDRRVEIRLEFLKPFAATNQTVFTFAPSAGSPAQTQVTWTMSGTNGFLSKAFSLFMDMDAMVGADFEKGLAAMKTEAETTAKTRAGVVPAVGR